MFTTFLSLFHVPLLSLQANRHLDLACSMEITALHLMQSALQSWNIALMGSACGHLLHTLEDLFGIPESLALKAEGEKLEVATAFTNVEETPEECAATVMERPGSDSTAPPPLKV